MSMLKRLFYLMKNSLIMTVTPKPIEKKSDIIFKCIWIVYAVVCFTMGVCFIFAEMDSGDIGNNIIYFLGGLWIGLGTCSLASLMFIIIKASWKFIVLGYKVGDQIKETNVTVRHEYGSNYKVTSTTETKGCLFGVIACMLSLLPWSAICAFTGPIIPVKRMIKTIKQIIDYKKANS